MFDMTIGENFARIQDSWSAICRTGNVRVEITFGGESLPYPLKMITFMEYPSVYKINKKCEVAFSYYTSTAK